MIARPIAPGSGVRQAFVALVLVAAATSCDRVPLTAPTESTIQLFSTATSVPLNGSTDLIATITEEAAPPSRMGRWSPLRRRSATSSRRNAYQNGKATVKLIAGSAVGHGDRHRVLRRRDQRWRRWRCGREYRGRDWGRRGGDDLGPCRAASVPPTGASDRSSRWCSTNRAISSKDPRHVFHHRGSPERVIGDHGRQRRGAGDSNHSTAATVTARAGAAEAATVDVTVTALPTIDLSVVGTAPPTVGTPVTFKPP